MFPHQSVAVICQRGRKTRLPDPALCVHHFHPKDSSFEMTYYNDYWKKRQSVLWLMLNGVYLEAIAVDPIGLKPEAIAWKLNRLFKKYLDHAGRRKDKIVPKLILIADPVAPGELFHPDPVVQEVLAQVRDTEFIFVPPTMPAIEFGYLFRYRPTCLTRKDILAELRSVTKELVAAYRENDCKRANDLSAWVSTLCRHFE